jgi:hypothetical protein
MTSSPFSPGGCIVVMGIKERGFDPLPREISLEVLVPQDNFYRRLEATLDLSFVRDMVLPLYARGGRPSVDPVVFFRLQLVTFFEGLHSERQLMRVAADRLSVLRYFDERYVDRVRSYRGTFPYEKALRKRRVWVEPLFAEAKDLHGMRRFRLRRLEKVNAEALVVAAGQNVKRLLTFGCRRPRREAQAAALRPPRRPSS